MFERDMPFTVFQKTMKGDLVTPVRSRKDKPAWDHYLTDISHMSLSKKEALQRKKMFVSKHNVLQTEESAEKDRKPLKRANRRKTPAKRTKPKELVYLSPDVDPTEESKAHTTVDVSSLDLLTNSMADTMVERTVDMFDSARARIESLQNTPFTVRKGAVLDAPGDMGHLGMDANEEEKHIVNENDKDEEDEHERHMSMLDSTPPPPPFTPATTHHASAIETPAPPRKESVRIRRMKTSSTPTKQAFGRTTRATKTASSHRMTSGGDGEEDFSATMGTIKALMGEMRYYEQLAGKRSVFDTTELEMALDVANIPGATVSANQVVKFLVQLVSQSMSHLLASAIEDRKRGDALDALQMKVDALSSKVDTGLAVQNVHRAASVGVMETPVTDFRHLGSDFQDNDGALGTLSPVPFNTSYSSPPSKVSARGVVDVEGGAGETPDDGSTFRDGPDFKDEQSVAGSETSRDLMRLPGTSASDWLFSNIPSSYNGSPVRSPTPSTSVAAPGAPSGKTREVSSTPVEDSLGRLTLSSFAPPSPPRGPVPQPMSIPDFAPVTTSSPAATAPAANVHVPANTPPRSAHTMPARPVKTEQQQNQHVPSPEALPQHPFRRLESSNPYSPSRYVRQSLGTYVNPENYLNDENENKENVN